MPQFTTEDRRLIEVENTLWNAIDLIGDAVPGAGAFTERIEKLRGELQSLAGEVRRYNDQFEVDE